VFKEGTRVDCALRVYADRANFGRLEIDLTDRYGNRPVRLCFNEKGSIVVMDGATERVIQSYQPGQWYELRCTVDASPKGSFSLLINGKPVLTNEKLAEAVKSIERLSLRTGPYRNLPNRQTPNETNDPPLPGADEPTTPTVFYVDSVRITSK
jgi:hypothetical protein